MLLTPYWVTFAIVMKILKPPKKKVLNHAVAISADLLITCFPIYDKTGFKNWHFSFITQSFRPTRSREKEVNS